MDNVGLVGLGSPKLSILDSKQSHPESNLEQKPDLAQVPLLREEPGKTSFTDGSLGNIQL